MIAQLQPYPDMRPTGLPWLHKLPAHWEVRRNGRLFAQRRQTGFPDLPVLEVSLRTGVRVRDFEGGGRKQATGDRSKYQRAVRGDIAYNMMRMWQGAVGIAPTDGLVSPAYVVATAYPEADAAYYTYLFRTTAYMHEVESYSRGIVPDRNRLYWEAFKQMPSAYPPLIEQRMIAHFLDWHGAMTARFIVTKKRLVALLDERKQFIIEHAISRGLDSKTDLKPVGVTGRMMIPSHWDVLKVRNVAKVVNGFPFDSSLFSADDGYPLIRIRDLNKNTTAVGYTGTPVEAAIVMPREVLIGMDGDFNVGTWNGDRPALLNQRMCCVRCHDDRHTEFVRYALAKPLKEINEVTWSTTVKHLSSSQVERIVLAMPPVTEIEEIVNHIKAQTAEIDRAQAKVVQEIALIQEFRTRLIADVVTGGLDVRGLALPEVDLEGAEIEVLGDAAVEAGDEDLAA